MDRAGTEFRQCLLMQFCPVSLVLIEPILRVKRGSFSPHVAVPGHLGKNRSTGDGEGKHIAVFDAGLRDGDIMQTEPSAFSLPSAAIAGRR